MNLLEDFHTLVTFQSCVRRLLRNVLENLGGVLWWHLSPFKTKRNETKPRRVKAKRNSLRSRKVEATTRQNKLSLCTLRGLSLMEDDAAGAVQDRPGKGQLSGGGAGSALGAGLADLLAGHARCPLHP